MPWHPLAGRTVFRLDMSMNSMTPALRSKVLSQMMYHRLTMTLCKQGEGALPLVCGGAAAGPGGTRQASWLRPPRSNNPAGGAPVPYGLVSFYIIVPSL